jgi:hypothetical protein
LKHFLTITIPTEMATFKGPFKFIGRIGNLRYYQVPGDERTYVAERGSVPKTILNKSPVFKGTRKARKEFGPKSMCAKDIRNALSDWSKPIVNRQLHCRLVSIMNDIVMLDKNPDKKFRALYLSKYKNLLYNADYHFITPLSEILRCPYTVKPDEDRKTVTVTINGLYPAKQIKAPALASHFQLCLSLGTVKDYMYSRFLFDWVPSKNNNTNIHKETLSAWIPVDSQLPEDITLSASLPEGYADYDDITIVRGFGIRFGRMTGEIVLLKREPGSIAFLGGV